jgi:hypothetical protein
MSDCGVLSVAIAVVYSPKADMEGVVVLYKMESSKSSESDPCWSRSNLITVLPGRREHESYIHKERTVHNLRFNCKRRK